MFVSTAAYQTYSNLILMLKDYENFVNSLSHHRRHPLCLAS